MTTSHDQAQAALRDTLNHVLPNLVEVIRTSPAFTQAAAGLSTGELRTLVHSYGSQRMQDALDELLDTVEEMIRPVRWTIHYRTGGTETWFWNVTLFSTTDKDSLEEEAQKIRDMGYPTVIVQMGTDLPNEYSPEGMVDDHPYLH